MCSLSSTMLENRASSVASIAPPFVSCVPSWWTFRMVSAVAVEMLPAVSHCVFVIASVKGGQIRWMGSLAEPRGITVGFFFFAMHLTEYTVLFTENIIRTSSSSSFLEPTVYYPHNSSQNYFFPSLYTVPSLQPLPSVSIYSFVHSTIIPPYLYL